MFWCKHILYLMRLFDLVLMETVAFIPYPGFWNQSLAVLLYSISGEGHCQWIFYGRKVKNVYLWVGTDGSYHLQLANKLANVFVTKSGLCVLMINSFQCTTLKAHLYPLSLQTHFNKHTHTQTHTAVTHWYSTFLIFVSGSPTHTHAYTQIFVWLAWENIYRHNALLWSSPYIYPKTSANSLVRTGQNVLTLH